MKQSRVINGGPEVEESLDTVSIGLEQALQSLVFGTFQNFFHILALTEEYTERSPTDRDAQEIMQRADVTPS